MALSFKFFIVFVLVVGLFVIALSESEAENIAVETPIENDATNKRDGISFYLSLLFKVLIFICLIVSSASTGLIVAVYIFTKWGKDYKPYNRKPAKLHGVDILLKQIDLNKPLGSPTSDANPLHTNCESVSPLNGEMPFTEEMEAALSQLLNTVMEYEVIPLYKELVFDTTPAVDEIKICMWYVFSCIAELFKSMDIASFLTGTLATCLTHHLQRIHQTQLAGEKIGEQGIFLLLPQISSPERERNFLRRLSEYFLYQCTPRSYFNCVPVRTLIREVLSCKVLEPTIDCICSPDWINEQLISLLRDSTPLMSSNASDFNLIEDLVVDGGISDSSLDMTELINAIQECSDEEKLENARQVLHKELLKCTENDNQTNGSDSTNGGKISRPLRVLDTVVSEHCISDLTKARAECVRRLLAVKAGLHNDQQQEPDNLPNTSFSSVLESSFCRRHLHQYLVSLQSFAATDGDEGQLSAAITASGVSAAITASGIAAAITASGVSALGLYCSLQELLAANANEHVSLRQQIHKVYIAEDCLHPVPLDESQKQLVWQLIVKGTEGEVSAPPLIGWLAGAVEEVGQFLQTRYSAGFLRSSQYKEMMEQASALQHPIACKTNVDASSDGNGLSVQSSKVSLIQQLLHAHSSVALHQEKKLYKTWALASLSNLGEEEKEICANELQEADNQLRMYESHLQHIQEWIDHIGQWRISVLNVVAREEKDNPEFVMLVSLEDSKMRNVQDDVVQPVVSSAASSESLLSLRELGENNCFSAEEVFKRENVEEDILMSLPNHVKSGDSLTDRSTMSAAKSKSLSFEKELSAGKNSAILNRTSLSQDQINVNGGKGHAISGSTVDSCAKSLDSLKTKSSQTSLEKLFGDASHSVSCSSSLGLMERDVFVDGEVTEGWVIIRKLSQFGDLHKKLSSAWPKLKTSVVPSLPSKSIFGKQSNERACLEKLRATAQKYLSALTWEEMDRGPCRSVLFYEFLCPSHQLLLRPVPTQQKKYKFSLSSFFKSRDGKSDLSDEEEVSAFTPVVRQSDSVTRSTSPLNTHHTLPVTTSCSSLSTDRSPLLPSPNPTHGEDGKPLSANGSMEGLPDTTGGEDGGHAPPGLSVVTDDSLLTEPLFTLLEEVCELRGMGKWHRKTLMSVIQVTHGKNITRQVKEWAKNLFTGDKIVNHINELEAWIFSEHLAHRTDEGESKEFSVISGFISGRQQKTAKQILETKQEAQFLFLALLPEVLIKLVGEQNARKGALRLFGVLQHHALNKNLLYNILDELLKELFPELKMYLSDVK